MVRIDLGTTEREVERSAGVLFVDLDGTLVRTDLLYEGILRSLHAGLGTLLLIFWTFVWNKAAGKKVLADRVSLDFSRLPWRHDVLHFLRQQQLNGIRLVLATAADTRWARAVATELELFDDVLASDGAANLKGERKLRAIEAYCRSQGFSSFDYIGDSAADIPIWKAARNGYAVDPTWSMSARMNDLPNLSPVFRERARPLLSALHALRLPQWIKNLLVFVPIGLAHDFWNFDKLLPAIAAFLGFGLCASAVYVVNDLLDIESDRHHPHKRQRPFASGRLHVAWGPPLALLCFCCGLAVGNLLSIEFFGVLVCYIIITSLYSAWLKKVVIVDVLILSSLYCLRIIAGGVATTTPVSEWLMGFAIFLFLSLAFAKRYSELTRLADEKATSAVGRGYQVSDWRLIESMGPTSGYLAVLVFALYIRSEEMTKLYANGWALWLICPLLIYWVSRIWIKATRRELPEDPVLFAVQDRTSWLVGTCVLLLVLLARPL